MPFYTIYIPLQMDTIDQVLDYLYSFINYETDTSFAYDTLHYNVTRTKRLLRLLGNPEKSMLLFHVAGTKGKGSVCTLLHNLLVIQGYKTGIFTSPHLDRINERIRVNDVEISNKVLIELANILPPIVEEFSETNKPTTFELLTAIAMLYFSRVGVQYAILETGMGGRFDSTNFAHTLAAIITSISYDHMDKLGSTITAIAREKAGIIKSRIPVVVGYQPYNVTSVLSEVAAARKAPYYDVRKRCRYTAVRMNEHGSIFNAIIDTVHLNRITLSLAGRHQIENTLTALCALKVTGLLPSENLIKKACSTVQIKARLELIRAIRPFLLDSAHNADSARVIAHALREFYHYKRLVAIVGIVKGKDVRGILTQIAPLCSMLIITEPVTHKEIDTESLYDTAQSIYPESRLIRNIENALNYAVQHTTFHDLILITGSFYTTSPARRIILKNIKEN